MAITLVQGGNAGVPVRSVELTLRWEPSSVVLDVSAFLLGASGKVGGDADMVFYNQPRHPQGGVTLRPVSGSGRGEFLLDLDRIPATVERIAFTITLEDPALTFASLAQARVGVSDAATGAELIEFVLPVAGMAETALIAAEVYRRADQWKFRAVAQGFFGGLAPLATGFGVEVAAEPAPPASPSPTPPAVPSTNHGLPPAAPLQSNSMSPPAVPLQSNSASASPASGSWSAAASPAGTLSARDAAVVSGGAPLSLHKVTLEKPGQSVRLEKRSAGYGPIRVNLNWHRPPPATGLKAVFLGGRGVDLDLGCLVELASGVRTVVQALGNSFGALGREPYVQLERDDRTGEVTEGENLIIDGDHWARIKRVLIYAFIYRGAANWDATDGVVTVQVPGEPLLEVRLSHGRNYLNLCAVAMIENIDGGLRVTKLVEYFGGHRELDRNYGWGLNWQAGSKG